MGGGSFSSKSHRSAVAGLASRGQTFARSHTAKSTGKYDDIAEALNPRKLKDGMRESCYTEGFDDVLPIVYGLDLTASMGTVPAFLQGELPNVLDMVVEQDITDHPNVMVIGFDDEHCINDAAFQMSQFEIEHDKLANALNEMIIPEMGGGNNGEAYHIFFYALAHHTRLECFEQEGKKGFAFLVCDEPPYYNNGDPSTEGMKPALAKELFGDSFETEKTMLESVRKASEMYHLFCIRPQDTCHGSDPRVHKMWVDMFAQADLSPDHVIQVESREDVIPTTAMCIGRLHGFDGDALVDVLKGKGVAGAQAAGAATQALTAYDGAGGSIVAADGTINGDLALAGSGRRRS